MLAKEPPKFVDKLNISSYIIGVSFTIMSFILIYLDKQRFDIIFIFEFILGILVISSLVICFIVKRFIINISICLVNMLLCIANFIIPFFEYKYSRFKHFYSIFIYIVIARQIALFGSIVTFMTKAFDYID